MSKGRRPQSMIYSIFGQIEEVAAEMMIDEGKITKIPQDEIPQEALWNTNPLTMEKLKAKFAVMVPRERQEEFDRLIADLRA